MTIGVVLSLAVSVGRWGGLVAQVGVAPGGAPPSASTPIDPAAGAVFVAEAPIVARNVAAAKQRALDDAFFQAVDVVVTKASTEAAGTLSPASLAQLRAGLRARARRYLRSYRIRSEGETAAGAYRVELEAEVDEVAVRRELERARGPAPSATGGAPASLLVAGTGSDDAGRTLAAAFESMGAKATFRPGLTDPSAARSQAARSGASLVAFYQATLDPEGSVRGAPVVAVACEVSLSMAATTGAGAPIGPPRSVRARAFDAKAEAARVECARRAATQLAAEARVTLASFASGAGPRAVTLVLGLDEPAAVDVVRRALSRMGAVSSHELRRISVGLVELRAVTRLDAQALVDAFARETNGALEVKPGAIAGDRAEARVRLVAGAAPPSLLETAGEAAPR